MTDAPPVIDTAFLAAAAAAELDDWGPLEEAAAAVFPRGGRGPRELHETVRKVYVVF